jgi:CRP-like cAMP-binding protein
MNFHHNEYIYFEGDPIDCIYVLSSGAIALVLPKFENKTYIHYRHGNTFGVVDILGCCLKNELAFDDYFNNKNQLERQFTVMASKTTDLMCLSVQDLERIKCEFQENYD